MGVSGLTENKLFKVRTLDQNNPYQVGVNGVLEVSNSDDGQTIIKYIIDDITYTSYVSDQNTDGSTENFLRVPFLNRGRKNYVKPNRSDSYSTSTIGELTREKIPGTRSGIRYSSHLGNGEIINRVVKPKTSPPTLSVGDTKYTTENFSYDQFITTNIVKQEKYVGLIDHPIVESDLFIERDEYAIFERHQRLSEINNLATLQRYRGGYFKNINTL